MKKFFVILLLIVFLSFLSGCTSLDEGTVTKKSYMPAYDSTYYTYIRTGNFKHFVPRHVYYPDSWEVCVKLEDKKDCWQVTEEFYDSVEVGDYIYKPEKESK